MVFDFIQKLNYLQTLKNYLSEFIGKLKAISRPQHAEFLRKLETLYEVTNSQNLKPELIIKIEKIVKQLKEQYDDSKTNEAVEQECLNNKASDGKSVSDNPNSSTSLLEFLTKPSDQDMKVKKHKSDKYNGNSRHQKHCHPKKHERSHRSSKCEWPKRCDRFKRDRQSHSVSPERSRDGRSEQYHYKKSDKYRSSHRRGEQKYDRFENGGNYSSPSKYRTSDSKLENKYECSDRNSSVRRRDNNELMVNPFNGRSNTACNRIDTTVQSNNLKLLDDKFTEFKASELTPRHITITGCAAERKVRNELGLLKPDTTSKKCASTLASEAVVEDSAILSFMETIIDTTSKSSPKHQDSCIETKNSKSVDDIITKMVTETTDVKNDVASLKPKGDSSTVVQSTSATTEIEEIEKKIIDVPVTSYRKTLNEVTHSNNLQYNRPTDLRLRFREQRLQEQRNSSLSYSKPTATIPSYAPVIQSKPANEVYERNQYLWPSPRPNTVNNPSNMTSQYTMPSHPIPLMNIVIPYPPTYAGHNRNPTTPMTYGEYKRSKAASEKLKNKIVMNTFNTGISKYRLDNVHRSSALVNGMVKTHYAAKTCNSNTTKSHWDDSNDIATGNSRRVANSDREASQIRDSPSESPSNEKQNHFVTSFTSILPDNSHSNEEMQSALKQLLNPNMLPTILNACGRALDDNMVSKLRDSIQSWNEANQPGNSQNPPTEVVQTTHYAAKTHNSYTTESDWDDSNEYAPGNNRRVVTSDREASQIRDPPSELPSTEKQNHFVTSFTSILTDNSQSSVNEEMQSALKQLLNPNLLPTILNACGRSLDDNMVSKLRDSIQSWNEANQPGNIQNSPTEVVQIVASKTPRKNELKKIHEYIRSMFTCDEVLSATGRRMSTVSSNAKKESVAAVNLKTRKHENQSRDDITIANKSECLLSGDANDIAKRLTRPCSIVLEKLHPLASVKMLSGIVNPKKDGRGKRQIDEIDDIQTVEAVKKKRFSMQTVTVKNNNPAWHYLNNTMDCQLCEKSVGISLISHYVNCHPDSEVFPSRVLPEVAEFLRNSKEAHKVERVATVVTEPYTTYEFKQSCYFCNETKSLTKMGWLHHISVHTGYYQYKCTVCKKRFSTSAKFHVCNTVRVRGNIEKESLPLFTQREIFGYLCDLCNFVRFEECEIKKHLRCEHEAYARANVNMKFKKIIFLSFPNKNIKMKSNVDEPIETKPRKRSMSVAKVDNDRELLSLKKLFRSHVVQSNASIVEPNGDGGLVKRGTKKLMKDAKFNSVQDKNRSKTRSFDRLSSDDGINTQHLIELNNVRESSKEKKSPATTSYIRKDNYTPSAEILEESDVDRQINSSNKSEADIPTSRLSNNNIVGVIDTTKHTTQKSISSLDPVLQLYSVDKLAGAIPQTEDKLTVKKEKDSEPDYTEGYVFINGETITAVANAKQRSIRDSTKLPILTQLTTPVTKPDSTLVTLNAPSIPAKGTDDSRIVSLKQWLDIPTSKLQKYCKTMLRDISMFALYKCMDTTCAFTTNDTELMLIHLWNHENHAVSKIYNQLDTDSPSWLECPYCNEIGDSCWLLLEHIQQEHQSSIFQCPYCFYRSCTDYNVIVHLSQFHQFEQKSILVCHGKPKDYATEKVFIEKSRHEFVRPLRCTDDCKKITFAMDHFVQHMKNSPAHSDKFRCQVCMCHIAISSAAKHLVCHRIGVLECVYCPYGTDAVERIQNHMCNSHPSKLPYICVRLMKSQDLTDKQLRSVESTLSVNLCQSVDPKLLRRCQYTEQQLNFLSPSIELNSILSESQVVPAPVPLKELTSSLLAPIDISSESSTNAETLGSSSSLPVLIGVISYENFKNAYVFDDYDTYFSSQSNNISPM